ncbi:hypothetical protein ACVWYN_001176 [Pedobacter sp. UYP24]
MIRKIIYGIVALIVIIQFFRPNKNIAATPSANAIELHYPVSKEIGALLKTSCYDCHSNHTTYPWYSNIQPVAWWLQDHIDEGKRELNFDEYNSYTSKKKKHKLDEVIDVIEHDEMPLTSYTLIHRKAVLTPQAKAELISWAKGLQKIIQ